MRYELILPFLATTVMISLSGVASPGPLTAVAITYGLKNKNAGILVSIGHAVIEVPLIILISIGILKFLASQFVKSFISITGGVVLIILGIQMFKNKNKILSETCKFYPNIILAGLFTTVSNPYFFIWWTTVGAKLIITAIKFGILGILIFSIAHLACDFFWYSFLANIVYNTKYILANNLWNKIVFVCCFVLIFFGLFFIYTGIKS